MLQTGGGRFIRPRCLAAHASTSSARSHPSASPIPRGKHFFSSNNAAKLGGARSYLAVPMLKEGEMIVAIAFIARMYDLFSDRQTG